MSESSVTPASVQVPSDPGAPVTFDFVSHALRVAFVDRDEAVSLPKMDWEQPGVYILLGSLTTGESTSVYVGKATNLRGRLLQHRVKPPIPWWRAVLVARDTTDGFHSAQIGYLEGRLAGQLRTAARIEVTEGQQTIDETLPDHLLISLDAFVPTIVAALRIAGLNISKSEKAKESDKEEVTVVGKKHYSVTVAQLAAKGLLKPGDKLFFDQGGVQAEGVVTTSGEILVDGATFPTPSGAGRYVLGGKAVNGWKAWTLGEDGPPLLEIRDKLLDDEGGLD